MVQFFCVCFFDICFSPPFQDYAKERYGVSSMIQSQEKPGQLKNTKSFCKREGGKEGKKLRTWLEKSFTKLFHSNPTGILPLRWDTFGICETLALGVPCPVVGSPVPGRH